MVSSPLVLAAAAAAVLSVGARAAAPPDPRALASYGFDAASPLPRARTIPDWLLGAWSAADGETYKAHRLTAEEEKSLAKAFAGLPAPMRKVLSERLIATYFIDGLKGNGITDWVLDPARGTYAYMILNPAGFKQTLSELLTERDGTVFAGKADVKVEAGSGSGILYTVSHESAHAVDYVMGVTPYTEDGHYKATHPVPRPRRDWDAWKDYSTPKAAADYPLRSKLHFYGFGSPDIDPDLASDLCAELAGSPFASLYGSRTWAEDLAELFVLRHLTQDLKQPVRRVCAGVTYEPWTNKTVRERALRLTQPLYRPQ